MKVKESERRSVVSDSLRSRGLYSPWSSPGQNPGVGSLSLLQGIFPTGIEPRSPALQGTSLPAETQKSPRTLEWVAYPFSSRSSPPRNQTRVCCIAGRFFTNRAIRKVLLLHRHLYYVSSIYCFLFFH